MTKIVNFVYLMIISFYVFLVSINVDGNTVFYPFQISFFNL